MESKSMAEGLSRIPPLHVVMASPEITPLAKTGGLGDVLGSLPKALERLGFRLSLVMPAYRSVLRAGFEIEDTGVDLSLPVLGNKKEGRLLKARIGNAISIYLIRADQYFDRDGLYGTPEGDYEDNAERFVFFCRAVLEVLKVEKPAILHAHDWQSALAIAFLKAQSHLYPQLSHVRTVFTVHNLGYQGLFTRRDWHVLNLDEHFFSPKFLEFWGEINFLKGGLVFADRITTVSPAYAEEIKTSEHGFGLDGVFRERAKDLVGILNGADYEIWNPKTDGFLHCKYGLNSLVGKKSCKAELQRILSLDINPDIPLLGMVSRLTSQKGFDLLEQAMFGLLSRGTQFVVLGTGDRHYEQFASRLTEQYPGRVGVKIDFDEAVAHKVIAGSDLLLMPSRYEPSGLTQLYSLRYGTIPIVRATGGLKDSVREFDPETGEGNGFVFSTYEVSSLLQALDRALELLRQKKHWSKLMSNAMSADFSWARSARSYADLYYDLAGYPSSPASGL